MPEPIRILFLCHGNICRSPMAEFMMKALVSQNHLEDAFEIASAGVSEEELGNPVYPPARRILEQHGISCAGKRARQVTRADYERYDYLLCAEEMNLRWLRRIIPDDPQGKIGLMLSFSRRPRDISDPWYSGNFTRTYQDLEEACETILTALRPKGR